jgi:hypothetical protein
MLFAPPNYAPLSRLRGATKNLLQSRAAWTPPGSFPPFIFLNYYPKYIYKIIFNPISNNIFKPFL